MSTVRAQLIGGLGNRMFIWSHAKAFCEQNGHELRTEPWVGERIFTLDGYTPKHPDGTEGIVIDGYRQTQDDLIYTRKDCRRWFAIKPYWLEKLRLGGFDFQPQPLAHLRYGDYRNSSYPLIGPRSIQRAMQEHGIDMEDGWVRVSDEKPQTNGDFPGDVSMLPDFYRMMCAPVLFRGNSTYSWWSACLGHARVFSPRIDGLAGGIEHDNVPYVEGNHCRCADLAFVTDLHLPE